MARPGRHLEGAQTRERVLEAAAKLIGAQGYAATSIARISKASGANPASIYWAFGSKEGLLAAVMERAAERWFDEMRALPQAPDPWRGLASLAASFEGGPEFLRLMVVLCLERRDGDPAVLEAARRVRTTAADALARTYAGALGLDDHGAGRQVGEGIGERIGEELARFTLMLLDGVFIASQIEPDATDLRRAFQLIATAVKATGERMVEDALAPETNRKGETR